MPFVGVDSKLTAGVTFLVQSSQREDRGRRLTEDTDGGQEAGKGPGWQQVREQSIYRWDPHDQIPSISITTVHVAQGTQTSLEQSRQTPVGGRGLCRGGRTTFSWME